MIAGDINIWNERMVLFVLRFSEKMWRLEFDSDYNRNLNIEETKVYKRIDPYELTDEQFFHDLDFRKTP